MAKCDNKIFTLTELLIGLLFLVLSVVFALSYNENKPRTDIQKETTDLYPSDSDMTQTEIYNSENTEVTVSETSVSEDETSVYVTPEDIVALQTEYIAAFSGQTFDGKVKEVFFTDDAATDKIGNVCIRNTTSTKKPDFEQLLIKGANLNIEDKSEPLVLIFHTHTTESYLQVDDGGFYKSYATRSDDNASNMVRVGNEIVKALEKNNIGVIHDTNIYDSSYDGAYARSREAVLSYLEQYPSIQIVLDVHRDAIYYSDTLRCKPTAVINGTKAAQIMIITGAEEGLVSSFPHWEDNLRFALALQSYAQKQYEGLMKPIYFCQRKYNMDTSLCSLLLEVGTDANTLEEACFSAGLLGNALAELINDYENR